MKVILLQDVAGVGKKYDVKNVADGHAQNFLIPRGLVVAGTKAAIADAECRRKTEETKKQIQADLLAKNLTSLEGVTIEMEAKANEQGHLFAAIHQEAIADELKRQKGIDVLPEFIRLEKPIKEAGEHRIEVAAGGEKKQFILRVTSAEV